MLKYYPNVIIYLLLITFTQTFARLLEVHVETRPQSGEDLEPKFLLGTLNLFDSQSWR